jgi:hypothetical protein
VLSLSGWNPFEDGILGHNLLLSQAFFSGNPFMDGILGHNLLSQAFFGGNPFMDGILGFHVAFFTNSFFFDNRILAIRKPLTRIFLFRWNLGYHEALFTNCSFSRWNLGYHEALFTNSFSFTMEFWLSRSLFHELFLFHDGILAIKEPFSQTFSLSRWNSGYQVAFFTNFFSFTMEF